MNNKGVVKSVYKAIKILEVISREQQLTIPAVAKILGIPKSSAYELVVTLQSEGFLEKDQKTNEFHLGVKLIELGYKAQENLEIRRVAGPVLKELNQELDETVHLTVLDADEVLYVECFESTKRLRTYSVIGVRAPLYCTAVGKALLAWQSREAIERIIREKAGKKFTANTMTDRTDLLKDLEKTRKRGYALDNSEHEEGVRCVGAAIRDFTGKVVASISVSGPVQRIAAEKTAEIGQLVKTKAAKISKLLGYHFIQH